MFLCYSMFLIRAYVYRTFFTEFCLQNMLVKFCGKNCDITISFFVYICRQKVQTHEIANMKFWEFLCIYFYIIIHIINHFVPCNFEFFYVPSRNTLKNVFLNTFIKINTFFYEIKDSFFLSSFYAIAYFVLPFLMRFNLCRIIFGRGKFSILHEHFCIFIFLFGRNIFYYKNSFHKK